MDEVGPCFVLHQQVHLVLAAVQLAGEQGLTIVHFLAHRKHILWDTLGA
jgi:hypothetical protein